MPVADLEVRYKGAITNNPQFQVTIHPKLEQHINGMKRELKFKYSFDKRTKKVIWG